MTRDDSPGDPEGDSEEPPDELLEAEPLPDAPGADDASVDVDLAPTRGGVAPLMSLADASAATRETSLSRLP
ncbi:MAG: hypothetical protein IT190_10210, partial [Microbacteriaceae bacterium]|nr:hypothetical protein [Microbacteriaceae bacterium]